MNIALQGLGLTAFKELVDYKCRTVNSQLYCSPQTPAVLLAYKKLQMAVNVVRTLTGQPTVAIDGDIGPGTVKAVGYSLLEGRKVATDSSLEAALGRKISASALTALDIAVYAEWIAQYLSNVGVSLQARRDAVQAAQGGLAPPLPSPSNTPGASAASNLPTFATYVGTSPGTTVMAIPGASATAAANTAATTAQNTVNATSHFARNLLIGGAAAVLLIGGAIGVRALLTRGKTDKVTKRRS